MIIWHYTINHACSEMAGRMLPNLIKRKITTIKANNRTPPAHFNHLHQLKYVNTSPFLPHPLPLTQYREPPVSSVEVGIIHVIAPIH